MGPEHFLHLVSSEAAADVVRQTLAELGRSEHVIAYRDAYNVGPLNRIDTTVADRLAWWSRIYGEPMAESESQELDDTERHQQVLASRSEFVLWHGPDPSERLFALRMCWLLQGRSSHVWEVALGPAPSPNLEAFYGKVALVDTEVTTAHWARRARVPDVAARAAQWASIRDEAGEWVWLLNGDSFVKQPLTGFDEKLKRACRDEWTEARLVVARVLSHQPVGDGFFFWRIRELLRGGELEGRGDDPALGMPAEVRSNR